MIKGGKVIYLAALEIKVVRERVGGMSPAILVTYGAVNVWSDKCVKSDFTNG